MNIKEKVFRKENIKLGIRALCCGLILSFIFSMTGFSAACKDIENRLLRFHIIANSDSMEDQNLKMKIRDEIVQYTDTLFRSCHSKEDAMNTAQENIDSIRLKAQQKVYSEGYDYPVTASVTKMEFDTRVYKDFTLPAGTYDAVRITIGSGKGHNWWCVLYPAVCVPSAEKNIGSALTESETDIVTESDKYIVKFKIIEFLENIFGN